MEQTPRLSARGTPSDRALDYPANLSNEQIVIWFDNGIQWPAADRRLSYLSATQTNPANGSALLTTSSADAAVFSNPADAVATLNYNTALRRAEYAGAKISTVAQMKIAHGFDEVVPGPVVEAESDLDSGPGF